MRTKTRIEAPVQSGMEGFMGPGTDPPTREDYFKPPSRIGRRHERL